MLSPMAEKSTKRTVTAENLQEAKRLREIWDAAKDRPSQAAFGEAYGIGNQAAVGFFLSGKSALSQKAAKGFAKGLGCVIGDFSPRIAGEISELADAAGIGWPFPLVDRALWEALDRDQRAYAQALVGQVFSACSSGKPTLLVQMQRVQPLQPSGQNAHSPAASKSREAFETDLMGSMEGKHGTSDSAGRVEGATDRRRPAKTAGKGRAR